MTAIVKREIKNYLKRPLFWVGMILVIFGVFQQLNPYLKIHYFTSEQEMEKYANASLADAYVSEGFVPSNEAQKRELWEKIIHQSLIDDIQMSEKKADDVISEMEGMGIEEACAYLEEEYGYFGAIYPYEDAAYHQGTMEEVNSYIESELQEHRFSWYFSRKFADFAGLFMAFFSTIMLAVLFLQDTKKYTYELLHTKPVRAWNYVGGKAMGGFCVCLIALAILNVVFWAACLICTKGNGFEISILDFAEATCLYILPNMLMIVCVYGFISLVFKSPLPAVPLLSLYIIYSNMGGRNAEGIYGYYGRPLAIMVRFPGGFFDTAPPPMALVNQSFLVAAAVGILILSVLFWQRRRF